MTGPETQPQEAETVAQRLEHLRGEIHAERISWGEIAELQSLAPHIESHDVELLQWAGVPEPGSEPREDETVDLTGVSLPRGRCDTCGAPVNDDGCSANPQHPVALP